MSPFSNPAELFSLDSLLSATLGSEGIVGQRCRFFSRHLFWIRNLESSLFDAFVLRITIVMLTNPFLVRISSSEMIFGGDQLL